MKYLKSLLFIFIIFLVPNVFASEFNMNNYTSATQGGTKNRYRATEIYNTGQSGTYTFGTRYNGRISDIETYFDYPFVSNTTYTITYNMNTNDFRNNFGSSYWWDCSQSMTNTNATVVSPSFISMKKVKFTFKTSSDTSCIRVWLRSTNLSSTAITGVSNWRLDNITIYDPDWQGSSNSGQGTVQPTPSSDPNENIINNNNQNTSDIISNNNQNTKDIIDNDNINFLRQYNQTRNQKSNSCSNFIQFDYSMGYHLKWNGDILESSDEYYTSDYVPFNSADLKYSITGSNSSNIDEYICFYDSSKNLLGGDCTYLRDRNSTAPSGSKYFRLSTKKYTTDIFYGYNGCSNRIDELNQNITNPNIDNGVGSDFFNNFTSEDFGLSQIITLPLTTIQTLANTSCVSLNIPIPFTNSTIPLPCMTQVYQTYIPTIFNIWQIVSFGIIAYFICIDIVHLVKGFKDPDSDKVEVLDL